MLVAQRLTASFRTGQRQQVVSSGRNDIDSTQNREPPMTVGIAPFERNAEGSLRSRRLQPVIRLLPADERPQRTSQKVSRIAAYAAIRTSRN
jgi:hypothetical protein